MRQLHQDPPPRSPRPINTSPSRNRAASYPINKLRLTEHSDPQRTTAAFAEFERVNTELAREVGRGVASKQNRQDTGDDLPLAKRQRRDKRFAESKPLQSREIFRHSRIRQPGPWVVTRKIFRILQQHQQKVRFRLLPSIKTGWSLHFHTKEKLVKDLVPGNIYLRTDGVLGCSTRSQYREPMLHRQLQLRLQLVSSLLDLHLRTKLTVKEFVLGILCPKSDGLLDCKNRERRIH